MDVRTDFFNVISCDKTAGPDPIVIDYFPRQCVLGNPLLVTFLGDTFCEMVEDILEILQCNGLMSLLWSCKSLVYCIHLRVNDL